LTTTATSPTRDVVTRWRECEVEDHEGVAKLVLALYAEDPAPTPVTLEMARATLRRFVAEPLRGRAVVLDASAGVVGYAFLCSFWSNELGGEVCIVDELYVAPAARGRGAATSLITGLSRRELPWFRDAVAVELEVTPGNTRARALYERMGFAAYKNALMRFRL
jgi:GNAT superfamily N-acetyltransferase